MIAPVASYAAIGDRFTEGMGDERPDGTRRLGDLVAQRSRMQLGQPIGYANLAIRGRLLAPTSTIVPAALALVPELLTSMAAATTSRVHVSRIGR